MASGDERPSPLDVEDVKQPVDDDGKPRRTGTEYTATAYIITAVIGSGVLSLSWSIAQMGWIAGLIVMLLFAWCTLYTSLLLADCYRHPDPVTGRRNYIYMDAVKATLSRWEYWLCGIMQYSNLIGTSISYIITSATSARAIQKLDCYHRTGGNGECLASTTPYIAVYGVIQIFLSLIPNFADIWWLSYVAAIMSFTYCFIVLGLGIGHSVAKQSHDYGTISGTTIGDPNINPNYETEAQKVWNILIALGNIAFAYSYSMIMLEIQDTLRSRPAENKQMKRATYYGVSAAAFLYVGAGITGYTAYGNAVCGNILNCFTTPYWLVNFTNTCVIIHLLGGFQVYSQPVYQFLEMSVEKRFPNSKFLSRGYANKFWIFDLNVFRATWRTAYVIVCTVIAMLLPFFNDILGIIGALGFWPLTVYFPVEMYIVNLKIRRYSRLWIALQTLSFVTFLVSLAALIGSVEGLILDVRHVKLFAAT